MIKVNNFNTLATKFTSAPEVPIEKTSAPASIPDQKPDSIVKSGNAKIDQPVQKNGLIDRFETKMINSADLNDTVKVPRTIFKGYLAFFAGTALTTIAAIAKNKHKKIANTLNIASALILTYGTFSFVRPYIIKGANKDIRD